jgi:hypothetical protein
MKRLFCALLLVCSVIGCDSQVTIDLGGVTRDLPVPVSPYHEYPEYEQEFPVVNLEMVFREENWLGPQGEGSCVHATMTMLFRWQGREDLAKKWRETYSDGEWYDALAAKFDKRGVRYAYTWKRNELSFLEWACSTRRGCGVTVKGGRHMVMLVHLDKKWAGLLDNNDIENVKWVPRDTFLSEWYNSNSWAVTPVYTPPPPFPYSEEEQK